MRINSMEWKYTKENPLRVVTLCSGYDSQLMAIRNLGIPYECVGWSEIDPYAIRAHNAVFPEIADRNLGDMTKIDWGGTRFRPPFLLHALHGLLQRRQASWRRGRLWHSLVYPLVDALRDSGEKAEVPHYGKCQGPCFRQVPPAFP